MIKNSREGDVVEKETTRTFEVQVLDGRDEGRHDRRFP